MASRKVGGIMPRTTIARPPTISVEYTAALKVLSNETMSQACSLALAAPTDENYQKLLEIYRESSRAANVIQKEAPLEMTMKPPGMPLSRGLAGSRAQAKPLGKTAATIVKSVVPNRRMARLPPALMNKRLSIQRQGSDSSNISSGSLPKRPRTGQGSISPPPPLPPVDDADNQLIPPDEVARVFLQKLNHEESLTKETAKMPALTPKATTPDRSQTSSPTPPAGSSSPDSSESDASEQSAADDSEVVCTPPTRSQPRRHQPKRTQPMRAEKVSKKEPPIQKETPRTPPTRRQPSRQKYS
jgi:hypothetical protein